MASEVRRGTVRVLSNYARLLSSVILGLLLVRLLLRSVGNDGWGLVALFGSTIGVAAMFQEIVRASMIRELGAAFHSDEEGRFTRTYSSAVVLSLLMSGLALMLFVALWLLVPVFDTNGMDDAARGLIAARGLETWLTIALAPTFNMYLVSERMVAYNTWTLLTQRVAHILGAAWIVYIVPTDDPTEGLLVFAWSSAIMVMLATLTACVVLMWTDRRMIPRIRHVSRESFRAILGMSRWNAVVVTAMNLHIRIDQMIMNFAFGIAGNAVFGFAVQLTSYARRIAEGMTDGLDAVSVRLTARAPTDALHALLFHSTRLHGLVTFPATVVIVLLAEPLLVLWVGDQMQNPAETIPPTIRMIQILALGIAVRGISDGWIRILYGAGFVRQYAPLVLVGGVLNPVIAVTLITLLPASWSDTGPSWAFTGIMTVIHGIMLPVLAARLLGRRLRDLYGPLLRPLIVACGMAPVIPICGTLVHGQWTLWHLLVALGAYGATYAVGTLLITLSADDRRLLFRTAMGRPAPVRE